MAALTATLWRTLRLRLLNNGVPDPMGLPTMHRLLDVTEAAILAGMDEGAADELLASLYPPEPVPVVAPAARRSVPAVVVPPPGFSEAEMRASYLAMSRAGGGDA